MSTSSIHTITYEEARAADVMKTIKIHKNIDNSFSIKDSELYGMAYRGPFNTVEEAKTCYVELFISLAPSTPID